ncbi:MAG: NERD domain-containing protein/DEAD/DEAH box helicase [Solirubrobacteraceae bacterium]
MATMFPRTLLADDQTSTGELKVFAALRDQLDDAWDVFHSVGILRSQDGAGARDAEVDFVLGHPEHGVVCLEVKGGDIECRHGEWLRRIDGKLQRVTDPFAQVTKQQYTLRDLLAERTGIVKQQLRLARGVVLCDVTVHSLALGTDAPAQIIVDRHGVQDMAAAVDRLVAFAAGARDKRVAPDRESVRDLLAPTFEIRVPMAEAFLAEDEQLVELTREQALALRRLARNHRMAIYGCAGSGKTMLAVEHARRLAEAGQEVLFVCFNAQLAAHLHATAKHPQIRYSTFHRLCVAQARRAQVELPDFGEDAPPQAYWLDVLPDKLADAVDVLGPQFDALVVDEAQDLHDHWLDALRLTLRDEEHAPVWLFLDDNQRIYDAKLEVPPHFFRYELGTNCRTTQSIHRELLKLYDGPVAPDAKGPEGRPPELRHSGDQAATVADVLERLLGPDDVPPADVVILSSHGREKSAVAAALGTRLLPVKPTKRDSGVRFSSIRAFKGLESPVVVLCELEDLDTATLNQQLYVGMSRARNHCIVVAPPAAG